MSATTNFRFTGSAAPDSHCSDCGSLLSTGTMRCYLHGLVCESCHNLLEKAGATAKAFGISPRAITVPLRHLNPAALGSKQERDDFATAMLQREREYEEAMQALPEQPLTEDDVDEMAERYTEGRRRHMFHKHNPHD